MNHSVNYNLNLPELSDSPDISKITENFETLDEIIKNNETHNHAANDINSGILGVARGGTGKSTNTLNSILVGNGANAIKNIATQLGAFFATGANEAPQFGVLPLSLGGTGATTVEDALTALGAAPANHTHSANAINEGTLSADRLPPVPITKGGTGSTTADGALAALGAATIDHEHTYDDEMSSSSENAAQNKVINAALALKANAGHNHSAGDINNGKLPIARGGTNAGTAAAALENLGAEAKTKSFHIDPTSSTSSIPITGTPKYCLIQAFVEDQMGYPNFSGAFILIAGGGSRYIYVHTNNSNYISAELSVSGSLSVNEHLWAFSRVGYDVICFY